MLGGAPKAPKSAVCADPQWIEGRSRVGRAYHSSSSRSFTVRWETVPVRLLNVRELGCACCCPSTVVHTASIDDHRMPSGGTEPVNGRDRNLESPVASPRVELGLGSVVRLLRRRGLVLVLIFAVTFGSIYFAAGQLPKRYSSVAWIKVKDPSVSIDSSGATINKTGASVDLTKEQRAAILALQSPKLNAELQKRLGPRFNDVQSVLATGLVASPLIRVDTSASTPKLAQESANLVTQFGAANLTARARSVLLSAAATEQQRSDVLATKVTNLSTQIGSVATTDPNYAVLSAKLSSASNALRDASTQAATSTAQAGIVDGGMAVYEEATLPVNPDFPQPLSWSIIGSLAVLLIAIAFLYGREELAGRFRTGDSSESRRAGARVLGVVPTDKGAVPRGVVVGAAVTFSELGLQLVHLLGRGRPNIVVVSGIDGPAPEGAARRLAAAIAESGARVVYAGCRILAGAADDQSFEAPVPRARLSVVDAELTGGRLRALDDGIAIGELTVARARTIMRRLTEQCEYVVIAAPSPVTEPATLVFAELADTTVLVAHHGSTRLRDAERAATRLRRVGGSVFGVVIDPVRPGPTHATEGRRTRDRGYTARASTS